MVLIFGFALSLLLPFLFALCPLSFALLEPGTLLQFWNALIL
jgi:hypothetical protein